MKRRTFLRALPAVTAGLAAAAKASSASVLPGKRMTATEILDQRVEFESTVTTLNTHFHDAFMKNWEAAVQQAESRFTFHNRTL